MWQSVKIGFVYFLCVFGAGFVLGPIRIFWLVPKVGIRTAELLESPVMIAVTWLVARWVVRRFKLPRHTASRFGIGAFALICLLSAEVAIGVALRGISISQIITDRDPVSGTVYFLSLALFALMPMLLGTYTSRCEPAAGMSFVSNRRQ
jgi:hypothetical protein